MIEKFDDQNGFCMADCMDKINEVIDAVNTIQKERESERFEIQEWIGILEAVRKSVNKLETMAKNTNTVLESLVQENNIHEKQIDELQMKLEPEKCKIPAENVLTKSLRMDKEFAEEECVRLQNDLERTCKALDVAIKYIKHTQKVSPFWFNRLANETLDKIKTALEQKEGE